MNPGSSPPPLFAAFTTRRAGLAFALLVLSLLAGACRERKSHPSWSAAELLEELMLLAQDAPDLNAAQAKQRLEAFARRAVHASVKVANAGVVSVYERDADWRTRPFFSSGYDRASLVYLEDAEPERLEKVLPFLEEGGTALMLGAAILGPWGLYPLLALIYGGVLKWAGGEMPFGTSLAVLLYSFMPGAVATLFVSPFLLKSGSINLYDPGRLVPNLTAFAGPETGLALWTLLGNIGVFTLWTIALLVIGYSIAAGITRLRATVCVVGLWAAWIAILVGLAALE